MNALVQQNTIRICLFALLAALPLAASSSSGVRKIVDIEDQAALQGVDLAIADDETYKRPTSWAYEPLDQMLPTQQLLLGDHTGPASRPGVSIAWRNAAQIEEVEVRVVNLGDQAAEGRIQVKILDESGALILQLEPPDDQKVIRIPAFDRGGKQGKIVRMKASRELNNLIDRFDRARKRYDVLASIETIGPDLDLSNNAKVKSWNVSFGVKPKRTNVFNYVFKNHESEPVSVRWLFEHTPIPKGWKIQGIPDSVAPFVLNPGEEVGGTLLLIAPGEIEEGAFLESRLSLINDADDSLFLQHEWFQVFDTQPPHVSNYRLVFTTDHRLAIQALVADSGSGVLEATGVTSEYSTDGGRTWSTRAHNYNAGNFVRPTLFEAVLGPFAEGTNVQLRFTAKDTAGNVTAIIPEDATGLAVPPSAEKLIDMAYIFPRDQANPIYTLSPGKVDMAALAASTKPDRLATQESQEKLVNILSQVPKQDSVVREVKLPRILSPGHELLEMTTLDVTVL